MAICLLTQGFDEECDDALGGIKAGQFLVARLDSITSFTELDGEITTIVMESGSQFFAYAMKKGDADSLATVVKTPGTGTKVATNVTNAILYKLSKEKNLELSLLASKPNVLIYQDEQDVWHCTGIKRGAELLNQTGGTGKEANTLNGYVLNFTTEEKEYPPEVDPTIIAALLTPAP